jgi:DNA-binding XRE family transcriptional regulator
MNKSPVAIFADVLEEELKDPKFAEDFAGEALKLDIALKIQKLRKAKKYTQKQFAQVMGTSQGAIARIESGDYDGFTLKTLQKIAAATGTKLDISFRQAKLKRAS